MRRMSFLPAPAHPPPRSEAQRGRGTIRSERSERRMGVGAQAARLTKALVQASRPASLPPSCFARWSPSPAPRGRKFTPAPPRVTLFLRPLRRVGEHLVGVLETRLALGDVEADGDDLFHHRGLLVGRQADQLAVLGPDLA